MGPECPKIMTADKKLCPSVPGPTPLRSSTAFSLKGTLCGNGGVPPSGRCMPPGGRGTAQALGARLPLPFLFPLLHLTAKPCCAFTGTLLFTAYPLSVKPGLGSQTKGRAQEMTESENQEAISLLLFTSMKTPTSEKLCFHLCFSSHCLWLPRETNSAYLCKHWHF